MTVWQLHEAATHFEEIIEEVQTSGGQIIARDGSEEAVVISIAEYRLLAALDFPNHPMRGSMADNFEVGRVPDIHPGGDDPSE